VGVRKLSVKVAGRERIVEIDDAEAPPRILVDGAPVAIAAHLAEPGVWVLRQGQSQTVAQVDGDGAKVTVALRRPSADPVLVAVEVADSRTARAAALASRAGAATTAPATIRSPIPGRIAKLLVKQGDRVTAGQAAVVLEAMKMENELRAPRAGTVQAVRCTEGAAVEAGQDLVVIG
jgi:biotin carboxyl carrier protein